MPNIKIEKLQNVIRMNHKVELNLNQLAKSRKNMINAN
jgi:hypothetical protein